MSENEFWIRGCEITKHKPENSYRIGLRRFRGLFGTTPPICSFIWARIAARNAHPPYSQPVHLLYALIFLKLYGTEEENKALTGKDEKTFRKWSWTYIELMARHLHMVGIPHYFISELFRPIALLTICKFVDIVSRTNFTSCCWPVLLRLVGRNGLSNSRTNAIRSLLFLS